jgi:hypothetical protein
LKLACFADHDLQSLSFVPDVRLSSEP